jgi:TolA-binding protein
MKRIATAFILSLFILLSIPVNESRCFATEKMEVKFSNEQDLIDKIWAKIRSLSPKTTNTSANTAVAGVKGAEKGSEVLEPVWLGEQKLAESNENKRYASIEMLINEEKYTNTISAIKLFQEDFPGSKLLPNVLFLKGLCFLKLDRQEEAVSLLNEFIENYPDQTLYKDAKSLLAILKSEKN